MRHRTLEKPGLRADRDPTTGENAMIWRICRGARLRALIAAAVLVAASGGEAVVYRWTDESGTPHFSDRPEDVPARFRDQLRAPADVLSEAPPINILSGLNPPAAAPEGSAAE
ncbi:MAG: DUF4124 domain-containing protein, partial [Myxococcales bacterium]|nr:DUF4124 domain-containing protein [Myxococcales bacterium]